MLKYLYKLYLSRKDSIMESKKIIKAKSVRQVKKEKGSKQTLPKKPIGVPKPIINEKEVAQMEKLAARYEKLTKQGWLVRQGEKAIEKIPEDLRKTVEHAFATISEKELIHQAMEYVAEGFKILEETAAKMSINEKDVIKKINKREDTFEIRTFDEIPYLRAYDIARVVNTYKDAHILTATIEGAITGVFGFAGIIPNLVVSMFLYFRAVQSVAMFYGYDVKNDPAEMEIASSVLVSAFSPKDDMSNNQLTATIGKFVTLSETTAVKQTAKKTWAEMAEKGGLPLLITQIRALANSSAKKALEKAGKEGLEKSAFKKILEQLGKKLSKKVVERAMPVVSGVIGAMFDTAQMKKVVNYADIFYCKRFIEEKETRIYYMSHPDEQIDFEKIVNVVEVTVDE